MFKDGRLMISTSEDTKQLPAFQEYGNPQEGVDLRRTYKLKRDSNDPGNQTSAYI